MIPTRARTGILSREHYGEELLSRAIMGILNQEHYTSMDSSAKLLLLLESDPAFSVDSLESWRDLLHAGNMAETAPFILPIHPDMTRLSVQDECSALIWIGT
jgi:hypothetical protein